MLLNRKFNDDSKNVLKTVIFLLQIGSTGDFVPDCSLKLSFWQFKTLIPVFSLTIPYFYHTMNLLVFFHVIEQEI